MKILFRRFIFMCSISLLLAGLAACAVDAPTPPETNPTSAPGEILSTASSTRDDPVPATESPTKDAGVLPTATPLSPTSTPQKATPQPKPSPTALALRTVPIEGGDPGNMFFAELVFPDAQTFTSSLWFRVYAHKPVESKVDGEGIEKVEFSILNSEGVVVHYRAEQTAGYCAFSGGEPDCLIWNFAEQQYKWPDGGKIVSGAYTMNVLVTSKDQVVMFLNDVPFNIQVP